MSNVSLLALAKADIKAAEMCVDHKDKLVKLHAAYCTQQAIEKTLKYVISLHTDDGSHPWGHDISKLVLQCKQLKINVPEYIIDKAAVFSSWEADTRYEASIIVRKDVIKKAMGIVKEWHKSL